MVHIIGYLPDWCRNVDHIPFEDIPDSPWVNTGKKLKIASQHFSRFVWTHDDIYFLQPVNLNYIDLPKAIYDFDEYNREEGYLSNFQKMLWATYDKCKELGLSGFSPEAHLPVFYQSEKLAKTFELFKIEEGEHLPHFAYFNLFLPGVDNLKWDLEIVGYYAFKDFKKHHDFGKAKFLNHNNKGLNNRLKKRIMSLFPSKSKFEK
jgi:hypothetical protein